MQFLDEKESIELVLPVGKYLVVEALTGTGKTVITRIDTTIFSIPRRLKVAEISNERIALGPYDADVRLIVQADTDIVEYDVVDDPSLVVDEGINAATQAALSGKVDKIVGRGLSSNDFTNAEKAKLAGIETGAQANTVSSVAGRTGDITLTAADVGLSDVDNTSDIDKPISYAVENALDGKSDSGHVHVIDEVVGLSAQLATLSAGAALGATAEQASNKGQPGGYVPLNGDGTISPAYLPSGGGIDNTDALTEGTTNLYFTQVRVRDTALTGLSTATATAVVATDSVLAASGKLQAQITATNTAVAAKANATDLTAHTTNTSNPHSTTKVQVGLGNVDNTSDLAKPVSTATQTALDAKENAIALGTGSQFFAGNKTWRDLATDVRATVLTGLSTATNAVITATDTVLSAAGKLQKQISDHVANVSNPHSTTKAQVGLGNVDNTSDANKPISTATQTALNAKANNASPTFTGTVTAADLAYTGTLTGGTGAINIGSGQIVKDTSGNVAIGGTVNKVTGLSGAGTGVTVQAAAAPTISVWDTSDATWYSSFGQISDIAYLCNIGNGPLAFGTNNAERVRIDASGNVGIGTTSPTEKLEVSGGNIRCLNTTSASQILVSNTGGLLLLAKDSSTGSNFGEAYSSNIYSEGIRALRFWTNNAERVRIDANGFLGLNDTPSLTQLQIKQSSTYGIGLNNSDATQNYAWRVDPGAGSPLILGTRTTSADLMWLSSAGNLGLCVTPSAWNTALKAVDIGNFGSYLTCGTTAYSASGYTFLGNNAYLNAGSDWVYRQSAPSVQYRQAIGAHTWFTAPSGTAGQPITFTQAMTLDASGNVLVGRTDPPIIWSSASTRVALKGNATNNAAEFMAESRDGAKSISLFASGTSNDAGLFIPSGTTNLVLGTNGTERARIDVAGNMGIGVTPSLWAGAASRGLEVGAFASLSSSNTYGTGLGFNVWHDGTNYIRRGANVVSFLQCDGSFRFRYAATGAAGSTVTFSDAMLINTSGNVGIGTASPTQRLHVNGTVQQTGSIVATTARTANYTATTSDYVIRCDPTTAAITVTLPAAASNTGRIYIIKRTTAGANAVTIDANASELIDGALTQTLTTQYQTLRICCNGTGWDII